MVYLVNALVNDRVSQCTAGNNRLVCVDAGWTFAVRSLAVLLAAMQSSDVKHTL